MSAKRFPISWRASAVITLTDSAANFTGCVDTGSRRLLIVGTREAIEAGDYRANVAPNAVKVLLSVAEHRYDAPVVFEPDAPAAAHCIETGVWWTARD